MLKRACFCWARPLGVVEMLAIAHAESGSPTEALVLFDRLEARHDFRPTAGHFSESGERLEQVGAVLDAASSFEKAVRLIPMHTRLGEIGPLVLKGSRKTAGSGLSQKRLCAVAKQRGVPPEPANTLADLGHRSGAEGLLRDLRRDVPESGLIAAALARVLLNGGEVNEALSLLKPGSRTGPQRSKVPPELWRAPGHVRSCEREPLEHFQKAIRLNPNYWAAWVDMGNLLDLGKLEEAKLWCFERSWCYSRPPGCVGRSGRLAQSGGRPSRGACLLGEGEGFSVVGQFDAVAHAMASSIGVGGAVALLVRMLDAPRTQTLSFVFAACFG